MIIIQSIMNLFFVILSLIMLFVSINEFIKTIKMAKEFQKRREGKAMNHKYYNFHLIPDPTLFIESENFGFIVEEETKEIFCPVNWINFCLDNNIHPIFGTLFHFIKAFPFKVANWLKWDLEQVVNATNKLYDNLIIKK